MKKGKVWLKMKRFNKVLFAVIMVGLMFCANLSAVGAVTVPNSAVVNHYEQGSGQNPLNVARGFAIKKATDGTLMYCLDYHLYAPSNTTYLNKGLTSDNGVAYIMRYAAKDKSYTTYFIGQTALWIYMLDTNQMRDSKNGVVAAYKNAVYSSKNNSNAVATKIRELVAGAKSAGKEEAPILNVQKSASFTLVDKTTYKSSVIKVNNNVSDYNITLSGAPSGTKTEKVAEGFVVMVPASSVGTSTINFTATVSATKNVVSTYVFYPSAGAYQPVAVPYSETVNLSDKMTLTLTPEKPDVAPTPKKQVNVVVENPKKECVVSVIKRAKDSNKILEGAKFELRDANGNVVNSWTSTSEAKVIYDLKANTKYTLVETVAPEGYELSGETVTIDTEDCTTTKEVNSYTDKETEVVEKESKVAPTVAPVKEIVVENPESVINVPVESTGMNAGVMGGIIGVGAIASGITIIYRKTRKNNL